MLAQPTDMKENLSRYKQEHIRYVMSECQIQQGKPPQIKTVSQIQFSGNIMNKRNLSWKWYLQVKTII